MTVSDPCVSLSTGALSPDERVNYVRGMVLGVDEFLQEQTYFLQKDWLHERALHGYGTVSGLAVSVTPAGNDFTVQVGLGIGVDQWGREFVLRCAQCANLGAWLAAQEAERAGTIAEHTGVSGELTVYVVASYATCLDDLVPLPGQPCSSSAQTSVAARIRDAWNIDLRWTPPAMPGWDADRRLARLLDSVEIVAGLDPADSDEDAIVADLLALPGFDAGATMWPPDLDVTGGISGPVPLRLPAATAADALDRIFTVWVTQVRPQLAPDLESPDAASDPAILLSTITFVPATPFDGSAPVIDSCDSPDDADRPFLLHTRLIQELQRLTGAVSTAPPRQLVTLNPVLDNANTLTSLAAQFHLDSNVELTAPVAVTSSSGWQGTFDFAGAAGFAALWTLTPPADFAAAEGDILAVTFDGTTIDLETGGPTLADALVAGLNVVDATPAGDVLAYAAVQIPHVAQAPPPQRATASKEWVTITPVASQKKGELAFQMWFHPEPVGTRDDAFVMKPDLQVFDDSDGAHLPVTNGPVQDSNYPNVWRVAVRQTERTPSYLRILFVAKETGMRTPDGDMSLAEWIAKRQIEFIGWDPREAVIVAFAQLASVLALDVSHG